MRDVIFEDSVQSGEVKQRIKAKYRKREISCMEVFGQEETGIGLITETSQLPVISA